jgi:hypothetical protein
LFGKVKVRRWNSEWNGVFGERFTMAGTRESALTNLQVARAKWPGMPRLWRSESERGLIQRLIWQWAWQAVKYRTARDCSIRQKARQLGVSHTHVRRVLAILGSEQELLQRVTPPEPLQRITLRLGMATLEEWAREHQWSEQERLQGALRQRYRNRCQRLRKGA